MKVLFATQSASLPVFESLHKVLAERAVVERSGFILADSWAYQKWANQRPGFEDEGHVLLKEWEVTSQRGGAPDLSKLARYEHDIGGEAGLFGALIADRRLFMGKDCAYNQDYKRRFTDEELLSILECGLEQVERLFDELKPDMLVGFICVTMLDYLAYLFARARGIRVLNLRPTRVGDRVTFASTLNDPAPEFLLAYQKTLSDENSVYLKEAREYIQRVREQDGRYEGVVAPSSKPALKLDVKRRAKWRSVVKILTNYFQYKSSVSASDNHVPNPLRMLFFNVIVNRLRAKIAAYYLRRHYIAPAEIKNVNYAFFPLHTEPEVSLLVYGRPFVNQIEVIRAIAMSLPVDMVLVVKEHPWMVGKRHFSAYQKILNIPRVRIVSPALTARDLILDAKLVTVVTGSVALEAAMLGKPVLTFGDCPYNALPDCMVHRCDDLRNLQIIIAGLLRDYSNDEAALVAYVAAVIQKSIGLNLYSTLLSKKNVYVEKAGEFSQEIEKLADYLVACSAVLDETSLIEPKLTVW